MHQATAVIVASVMALAALGGCAVPAHHAPHPAGTLPPDPAQTPVERPLSATPVLDLGAMPALADIVPRLADRRVVFVGETHDNYAHHLAQLEIIRQLHALYPRLAIGMEFFQQPFQAVLDDYIAGRLDEREMLRQSEYYSRWKFDYRLYAPILRYAREHRLPVVALNLPSELTRKVAGEGMEALSGTERAQLPADIDRTDSGYAQRLRQVFDRHPASGNGFDRFLDVQLLWDEGMAERAARYLAEHPDERMVVLAGSGHIAWGSGIPRRLARRLPVDSASVLIDWQGELAPELADYVLLTEARPLPPTGQLGVLLEDGDGVPTVGHCMSDSPCARAGLQPGDRLLSIEGKPLAGLADLRLAMWDRQPGERVTLRISRKRWFSAPREFTYTLELR